METQKTIAPFYMVYVKDEQMPRFKHSGLVQAQDEAKRLAKTIGKESFVLQPVESYKPTNPPLVKTEFDPDPLPF